MGGKCPGLEKWGYRKIPERTLHPQLSMSTACEGCRVGDGRDGSGWSSVQIQVTPSLLSSR